MCALSGGMSRAATEDKEPLAKYDAPSIRYGAAFYKGDFYDDMERLGIPEKDQLEIVWGVTDAIERELLANPSENLLHYVEMAQREWRFHIKEYVAKNKKVDVQSGAADVI